MGQCLGKLPCFRRSMYILLIGLDGAGKTSLLYRLTLGEEVNTVPTMAMHQESFVYKPHGNVDLTIRDLGGVEEVRKSWLPHAMQDDRSWHGVVFVIDSTDRARLLETNRLSVSSSSSCNHTIIESHTKSIFQQFVTE